MGAALDSYMSNHPAHSAEQRAVRRSLGPRGKARPVDKAEEAAYAMIAYLEVAKQRLDLAIETVKQGLAVSQQIRS
jgi:hypothetical protein